VAADEYDELQAGVPKAAGDLPAALCRKGEYGCLEATRAVSRGDVRAEWRRGGIEPYTVDGQLSQTGFEGGFVTKT
jgi:hypothetical protein